MQVRLSSIYICPQSCYSDLLVTEQTFVLLGPPNLSLMKLSHFFSGKPLFLGEILMELSLHTHAHTHIPSAPHDYSGAQLPVNNDWFHVDI